MSCPSCGAATSPVLQLPDVPVHQNLPLASREEARAARRGALDLRACGACGLVANAAFEPALLSYDERYQGSQAASPRFVRHLEEVSDLLIARGARGKTIVEVGCGKGDFLRVLCARGDNRGVGYDASYDGPEDGGPTRGGSGSGGSGSGGSEGGAVRFVRSFDVEAGEADLIVCRHVIEHVPSPAQFVADVLRSARPGAQVLFEAPALEWILEGAAFWDLFYEHCNYFTAPALATTLARGGCGAVDVQRAFGGQYQLAFATVELGVQPEAAALPAAAVVDFAARAAVLQARVATLIDRLAADGGVALWGAGAKGATLATRLDPDARTIAALVDLNPKKQGRFIPGSGHAIVAPAAIRGRARHALVMNGVYAGEIQQIVREQALGLELHVLEEL